MVGGILNRILKIFFAFVFIVVLVGFMFLSVRNYIMPEVNVTKIQDNSMLVKKYYFSGIVKPRKTIEIKADEKMYISDINVKNGQIVQPGIDLIIFDNSKQNLSINTKISDLKNKIKIAEIEKLNYKKQLDNTKFSVTKLKDLLNKAEEEYKKTSLLYDNDVITEKELEEKRDNMNSCKSDYENSLETLQGETQIYNMNIIKLDEEVKTLQAELQVELNGNNDVEYKLTLDKNGGYSLSDRVYIEYITDQKVINEGDTVIKYSVYNSNSDMYIEAKVDRKTYEKAFNNNCTLYFWKTDEKKKNSISVESIREFSDYSEIVFPFGGEPNESIIVLDNLAFLAQAEERYSIVVEKTAVVSIGDLKEDNFCYIYLVKTEDSILGETQYLKQSKYKILAVGDSMVALEPDKGSENLDRFSVVVNYVSSILEDKMRVRVVD